ncbi:MAG: glycosyltransferase [Muribaculaceae bacterium]|nr:glycosyltransferase [Muribaculaceae bacterium]
MPTVSVIVAIYNHFNWLRMILDALRMQSYKGFEVVIADDGSNEQTVKAIADYCASHPEMRIIHSWQPDEGWRKPKCLNKAVIAASGEFLVFIDGDCVPHPRFVEDHLQLRKRGRVFGGRRVEMSKPVSDYMENQRILSPGYFSILQQNILKNIFSSPLSLTWEQIRRTVRFPFIFGKPLQLKRVGFMGCNFSIYRSDLESVNGFDERYIDPGTGEDTDLCVRLKNAGITCIKSSRYALMFHRCHARLDFTSPNNARLIREAQDKKVTFVEEGLVKKTHPTKNINVGATSVKCPQMEVFCDEIKN